MRGPIACVTIGLIGSIVFFSLVRLEPSLSPVWLVANGIMWVTLIVASNLSVK